jgi:hypothetical protein
MKFSATSDKASSGHAKNQSMKELLIKPGKDLQRNLRVSPAGDMQSMI